MIQKFKLAFHFEASDFDSFLLMSDDLDGLLHRVLGSTELGKAFRLGEDYEDEGATFYGDFDGSNCEALLEAFNGEIKYGIVTAIFDAQLTELNSPTWEQLSTTLRQLRTEEFPGAGLWSAFDAAPVGVSIAEVLDDDLGSVNHLDFSNQQAMLRSIQAIENLAAENQDAQGFLAFFEPELSRIKADTASKFLTTWMSCELALSQRKLARVTGDVVVSMEVLDFDATNFAWKRPENLPVLLGIERETSPEAMLWPSPLPSNPYRENSDAGWAYQDILSAFDHVYGTAKTFSVLKAAVVMQLLAAFQEEYSPSGAILKLLDQYSDEIEEVSSLIGEEYEWDYDTTLKGEKDDYIMSLKLPDNLEQFWHDWLGAIGQKP